MDDQNQNNPQAAQQDPAVTPQNPPPAPQEQQSTPEAAPQTPPAPATPPAEQSQQSPSEPPPAPQEPPPAEQPQTPQEAAPAEQTPAAPENAPAEQAQAPQAPPAPPSEPLPPITDENWDHKQVQINRTFYKTFSPRIFYFPFSLEVDIVRAKQAAQKAGYQVPENAIVIDKAGMFFTDLYVEIVGVDPAKQDSNVLTVNKTFDTLSSKNSWFKLRGEIADIKQQHGQEPQDLYVLHTSNIKGERQQDIQKILMAA